MPQIQIDIDSKETFIVKLTAEDCAKPFEEVEARVFRPAWAKMNAIQEARNVKVQTKS